MNRFVCASLSVALAAGVAGTAFGLEESKVLSSTRLYKPNESTLRFEMHTGLAWGNAAVSTGVPTDNRVAMLVGVSVETPLVGRVLYLQPELNIVPKGGDNTHFGPKGLTTLTYLEAPLLLKAKFQAGSVNPFLLGGFGLGFLVGRAVPVGAAPDIRTFDVTAHFGFGLAMRLNESSDASAVTVAVRYSQGLIDADAGPNSWYSQSYSLLLGFQI